MRLPGTFTPAETAKKLRTSIKRIRSLIESNQLAAINYASESSSRPFYLISEEAIEAYRDRIVHQSLNAASITSRRPQQGMKRTVGRHV